MALFKIYVFPIVAGLFSAYLHASNLPDDLLDKSLAELMVIKVTTVSKQEERIVDAPGTVIVVTRNQIKQRGYRNLLEVLAGLPGIDIQNYADGTSFNKIAFRGVTGNNKFLILQDGIRINSPTGEPIQIADNFPLYHVKQIEVVYGPASALYGADALNGVINIITQDPNDIDGFTVGIEGGENDYAYTYVNGAIRFSDTVAMSIGFHSHESDNPDLSDDYPEVFALNDLASGFPATVKVLAGDREGYAAPTESESANIKLKVLDSFDFGWNYSSFTNQTSVGAIADVVDYGPDAPYETQLNTFYGKYQQQRNESLSWNITLSYSEFEVNNDSRFINVFTDFADVGYKYSEGTRKQIEPQVTLQWLKTSFVGGLTYEDFYSLPKTANLNHPYDAGKSPGGQVGLYHAGTNNQLPIKIIDLDYENKGAFVQAKTPWTDRLASTIGIRYDDSSTYGSTTNPRLAFVYNPNSKTTWKFLYGEAFLAPSPFFAYENFGAFAGFQNGDGLYESFFFHVPNEDLEPEEMKTMEINVQRQWGKEWTVTLVLYDLEVDGLILTTPLPFGTASDFVPGGLVAFDSAGHFAETNDNVGAIDATGLDLFFTYQRELFAGNLSVWGSYSYVNGELHANDGSYEIPAPFVSEHKAKFGMTYIYRTRYIITPSLNYVGDIDAFVTDTSNPLFGTKIKGHTIVNLNMSAERLWNNISLEFKITNLFDKKHYNAAFGGSALYEVPQDTRVFYLGLRYDF